MKLSFLNNVDSFKVRRDIMKAVKANKEREKNHTFYTDMLSNALNPGQEVDSHKKQTIDFTDNILDIRYISKYD